MSHATQGSSQGLRGGDTGLGGVARGGSGTGATARKPGRPSQVGGRGGKTGGIAVPELAVFAGAKRMQLAMLSRSAVTAALRKGLEEVTRVASLRPQTLGRTQVLARLRAVSRPAVPWEEFGSQKGESQLARMPVRGNRAHAG